MKPAAPPHLPLTSQAVHSAELVLPTAAAMLVLRGLRWASPFPPTVGRVEGALHNGCFRLFVCWRVLKFGNWVVHLARRRLRRRQLGRQARTTRVLFETSDAEYRLCNISDCPALHWCDSSAYSAGRQSGQRCFAPDIFEVEICTTEMTVDASAQLQMYPMHPAKCLPVPLSRMCMLAPCLCSIGTHSCDCKQARRMVLLLGVRVLTQDVCLCRYGYNLGDKGPQLQTRALERRRADLGSRAQSRTWTMP